MERYEPGIGVVAGSMMLKWDLLDRHFQLNPIELKSGDDLNVFINFETIIQNLSTQKGLMNIVAIHKQKLVIELEAAILNLMAAYRAYFKRLKCNVKMYFYYTALGEEKQQMRVYNRFYRDYYQSRYLQNPNFNMMGQLLVNTIIPEIELILSYIPDCYFLTSHGFDGSVLPMVIANSTGSKNVIISGDIFDTLYMYEPNFAVIYVKRKFYVFDVTSDIDSTVATIIKGESMHDLGIFHTELYYRLLLSVKGSKIRNIASARGFGYNRFVKAVSDGVNNGMMLSSFESIDSIIDQFPEKYRADIKTAFQCTSIITQYDLLSDSDISGVESQIIDRSDMDSINALNNRRFLDFPINLSSLLQE